MCQKKMPTKPMAKKRCTLPVTRGPPNRWLMTDANESSELNSVMPVSTSMMVQMAKHRCASRQIAGQRR